MNYASFGDRLVAYIIDFILLSFVMGIIIVPFFGIGLFTGEMFKEGFEDNPAAGLAYIGTMFSTMGILFIIPLLYDALMVASPRQGTLGKNVMKIKVVDKNGGQLPLGASIGRVLIKVVSSSACILLWLWPLFNDKVQALHDLAVSSFVVKNDR
jgi:uncharacterized RDD family membrane protein YckC